MDDLGFDNAENRQTIEKGFGACSIRDYAFGGVSAAIVVNMKNCTMACLTEREIVAIVLHELGHILNEADLEPEPTLEFCFIRQIQFSRELLDKVQIANGIKMEAYPDSYVSQHGYRQELLSTFDKQNHFFEQKIGYYAERMEKLQTADYLEGKIMSAKWQRKRS